MPPFTVFLDRDGTLNRPPGPGRYVTDPDDLILLEGAGTAVRRLNEAGAVVVVATNQRGVSLGFMEEPALERVNERLRAHLARYGAHLDAIYSCPHDTGMCDCRKPGTGLFELAMHDDDRIRHTRLFMVGDSDSDIEAGRSVGATTILIRPGGAGPAAADRVVESVGEAVQWILDEVEEGQASRQGRIELLGLPIDVLSEAQVVDRLVAAFQRGRGGWVVTPNLDVMRQVVRHPDLAALVRRATLSVADGMPLVWASRLLRTPLPERVAGATLIWTLSRRAAECGIPVLLLGGAPGVAEAAARRLSATFPGLVTGTHAPPFGFESDQRASQAISDALAAFGPCICFCGLGFPKQEILMDRVAQEFPRTWFIGSGASLSFVAGRTKRAPRWMQHLGLEWFYRLFREPRRLFHRYIVDDVPFAVRLLLTSLVRSVGLTGGHHHRPGP